MIPNDKLMAGATIGTFLLLIVLIFAPLPDKNAQIFQAIVMLMLGFFFGSSINKNREVKKDETIITTIPIDNP